MRSSAARSTRPLVDQQGFERFDPERQIGGNGLMIGGLVRVHITGFAPATIPAAPVAAVFRKPRRPTESCDLAIERLR
jgi:hypothetical protein